MRRFWISLLLCGALHGGDVVITAHKRADSVGFYNAENGRSIATVPVGSKPHEFVLSGDARVLYVTNYGVDSYNDSAPGGNTISIIDVARRSSLGNIDLGRFRRPHGIERGRSGRLYVTTDLPPSLLVIDPGKKSVLRDIAIGQETPHMVAVTPDEKKAYTANSNSGTVSALLLESAAAPKHIRVGGVPMGFCMVPDGRLFATTRTDNSVVLIDTKTDSVVRRIPVTGEPVRLRLTPDGKKLLVTLIGSGELAVVDLKDYTVTRRVQVGKQAEGIAVDQAGRFAYASAQGDDVIVKLSLADFQPVLKIKTASRPDPIVVVSER